MSCDQKESLQSNNTFNAFDRVYEYGHNISECSLVLAFTTWRMKKKKESESQRIKNSLEERSALQHSF